MKELFIVEGVSAASNLNSALDKASQQIHAVQGKLINVETASMQSVVNDSTCAELIDAIGCELGDACDIKTLRFSNILIVCDPDIDGKHAGALLMSFFFRYFRPVVEQKKLRLIKVPMYKVQSEGYSDQYAYTKSELSQLTKACADSRITQFKGIAQFSKAECHRLLLHPATRCEFVLTL